MSRDPRLRTRLDFDQAFGTAINRFSCQAVIEHPLTPYGAGGQVRGFLPLRDSMQCLTLGLENPPAPGEYRVFNQFEETYSIRGLADVVQRAAREVGLKVEVAPVENPRAAIERQEHHFAPDHSRLLELGYKPTHDVASEVKDMLEDLLPYRERVAKHQQALLPNVHWSGSRQRVNFLVEPEKGQTLEEAVAASTPHAKSEAEYLPFHRPSIEEEDLVAVRRALQSGWLTLGPVCREFETEFAAHVGASRAVSLSSGTAALHLALVAKGIGPGDEVITTPLTFCSSAHVIEHVGAIPIFADIDPFTLQIDPAQIERVMGPRTKAIIAVDYGGHPCHIEDIVKLARDRDVTVIEDAAHSLGAAVGDRPIGSIADVTAFSFYATKNITTGDGGMLVTDDPAVCRSGRAAETARYRTRRVGPVPAGRVMALRGDGGRFQGQHDRLPGRSRDEPIAP